MTYRLSSEEEVYHLQKIELDYSFIITIIMNMLMYGIICLFMLCLVKNFTLNVSFSILPMIYVVSPIYIILIIMSMYDVIVSSMYYLYSNVLDIQLPSVDTYILWVACDKHYYRNF